MSDVNKDKEEPTQKTNPKKGDPILIPIPPKAQIERDFTKIALAENHDEENGGSDEEA